MLLYNFRGCNEGVYIHTRDDSKLFNIHLRGKTKLIDIHIHELLFADDAPLLQLASRLSHVCKVFGLIISLKETCVMAQVQASLDLRLWRISFIVFGSTIASLLSMKAEL